MFRHIRDKIRPPSRLSRRRDCFVQIMWSNRRSSEHARSSSVMHATRAPPSFAFLKESFQPRRQMRKAEKSAFSPVPQHQRPLSSSFSLPLSFSSSRARIHKNKPRPASSGSPDLSRRQDCSVQNVRSDKRSSEHAKSSSFSTTAKHVPSSFSFLNQSFAPRR